MPEIGGPCPQKDYCFNNGDCEFHENNIQVCRCPSPFTGSRCNDIDPFQNSNPNKHNTNNALQIWIPVTCIIALSVMICAYIIYRKCYAAKKRQTRYEKEAPTHCIEPGRGVNPHWGNGNAIAVNQKESPISTSTCPHSANSNNSNSGLFVQTSGHACNGIDGQITIYLTKENISVLSRALPERKTGVTFVNEKQAEESKESSEEKTRKSSASYENQCFEKE